MLEWLRRRLRLDVIEAGLRRVELNQEKNMATLSDVVQKVEVLTTVVDSAGALLAGLAQKIRDLEPNQAAIDKLADDIDAQNAELAAAVAAHTPGDPSAPATPPNQPPVTPASAASRRTR